MNSNPLEITEKEFETNFEFVIELVSRCKAVFKVRTNEGKYVMVIPTSEFDMNPIAPEVRQVVEEFRNDFLSKDSPLDIQA